MNKMAENKLLNSGGVIVCEHSHELELPQTIGDISQIKHEKYGIIGVTIYSRV